MSRKDTAGCADWLEDPLKVRCGVAYSDVERTKASLYTGRSRSKSDQRPSTANQEKTSIARLSCDKSFVYGRNVFDGDFDHLLYRLLLHYIAYDQIEDLLEQSLQLHGPLTHADLRSGTACTLPVVDGTLVNIRNILQKGRGD
ncbi:hypothetical protein PHLCEN_2v64 [Hermanssonia centrifuga]|uniref:Uncharacterized protein n=1 Tax=Hermanssonia centrifuga TaxID=98765 RepID=A0A2R6S709_9APHY|nr:hypothetical protein PHLCEN_2v64 [Hermanssonia centrifuga]